MRKLRFYTLICILIASLGAVGLAIYFNNHTAFDRRSLIEEAEKLSGRPFDISRFETADDLPIPEKNAGAKFWVIYLVSGCDACRKLLPLAEKVRQEPDSRIQVVGIMADSDDNISRFVEEHKIGFPILRDSDAAFMRSMNLRYFPTSLLVNDGIISKAFLGMPRDDDVLRNFLGY